MNQYTLFVLLSPFACVISLAVAVYSWQHNKARAAKPLALVMAAVTGYLFFNTLELVSPTPEATLFFAQVCYVFIALLTVGWFLFALEYAKHDRWIKPWFFRLLWVIPVITVVLAFTNDLHHLIWMDYAFFPVGNGYLTLRVRVYGTWFWFFWLQAYFLILSGAVVIFLADFTPNGNFRKYSRWALAGALLPLALNLVYVLKLIPGFYKDYSPLCYAASGILFAISIFRRRLLELTPFARTILVDSMDDGVVILDAEFRVADINPAALKLLQDTQPVTISQPYAPLKPYLQQFDVAANKDFIQTEISLPRGMVHRHFDLHLRRLRDQQNEVVGYLITFHNITEHKQILHVTERLAEQDSLTGMLNRRYFLSLAQMEAERAVEQHENYSLLMIDLDYFKKINDTFGHRAGDHVLQSFAQILGSSLRGSDLVGRMGGDEFVALLPNTDAHQARVLADRLRDQMRNHAFHVAGVETVYLTFSVGLAEFLWNQPVSVDQIIDLADRNLYQAKSAGRDQVV